MNMIERVARAIYHGTFRNKPYDNLSAFKRARYLAEARAAIEAMREPADGMIQRGLDAWVRDSARPMNSAYKAMIDAALKEDGK